MNNRYNDNYSYLCKIKNYIKKKYNYDKFTILSIHMNKSFKNTKNMINYTNTKNLRNELKYANNIKKRL
jgi:hypothetical protein